MLTQPPTDPAGNRKLYGLMQRHAQRLLHLINQLMDISRLEAGSTPLRARKEDLVQYLRGLVFSFASLADSQGIQLQFRAADEELLVYFDRDKLEKTINNLLANAFKFTPEGGEISVTVAGSPNAEAAAATRKNGKAAGWVEIAVQDSGHGIPADQLGRIFDRFYRVDDTPAQEPGGTGIGLALAKELVALHRGEITVVSEVGRGTRFTVRLPLGKDHLRESDIVAQPVSVTPFAASVPEALPPNGFQPDGEGYRASDVPQEVTEELIGESGRELLGELPLLLIVEDNTDVCHYIADIFAASYRTLTAADGLAGLARAVETVPDLIISDRMMPGMDGIELCGKLKTDERTSHIPVILLTAKAGVENRVEGLEGGADDYLTKPFYPFELRARVKNLVEQRRKLRERFSRELVLQPKQIAVTSADEKFLQRALDTLEKHLSDSDFTVERFGEEMNMGRVQLHRKLKALTEQAPRDFIRVFRLKRAAQLLEQKWGNVAEVAYAVGFDNLPYFTQCFRQTFGQTPSRYEGQPAKTT